MAARHPIIVLQGIVLLAAASLAEAARADLAANSPFSPAGTAGPGAAAAAAGPIELRGMTSMGGQASFLIYDVNKKKDIWVGMNEAGNDFVVRAVDPGSDAVTVDYQGHSMKLELHTSKVASSGNAMPPTGVAPGASPAVASTAVAGQPPSDEQRRLDAVAQEVRRRRMERERAAQGGQDQAPGAFPNVPNR
jgi:hypothetical protein